MESIKKALQGRNYQEPPEIEQIKQAVKNIIGTEPKIAINNDVIAITVPSAGAAGTLRPEIDNIEQKINSGKRLVIRIG